MASSLSWRRFVATFVVAVVAMAGGLVALAPGAAATTAASRQATGCTTPSTPSEHFVEAIYLHVMMRCPDPGGLAYWSGLLDGGTSRSVVVWGIALSHEDLAVNVTSVYRNLLRVEPTPQQLSDGIAMVRSQRNAAGFISTALGSQDAYNLVWDAGTSTCALDAPPAKQGAITQDDCFISFVYYSILNRQVDPSGLAYWSSVFQSGATGSSTVASRTAMVAAVYQSPEAASRAISTYYMAILGRPVDQGGYAYWTAFFARTHNLLAFEVALYCSPEFYNDAQQPPTSTARPEARGGQPAATPQLLLLNS